MAVRILAIEDNPDNMKLLSWILGDRGWDMEGCYNAEDGLRALQERPFDLVLMDISLPGMDGKQATRILRADPRFSRLPILALTAHAVAGETEEILGSGITAIVTKPIDEESLLEVLDGILASR